MSSKYVVVGIPALNESKTISYVTEVIDQALQELNYNYEIVLIDSNSIDKTVLNFKSSNVKGKSSVIINNDFKGKGDNLLKFFEYFKKVNGNYALLFDADLESITKDWVSSYLSKLEDGANLVTPNYKRSKYEASATNHLAFPFFAYFGFYIRQPLAGDFALDENFINKILETKYNDSIRKFGIDIFISYMSIYYSMIRNTVVLGSKVHKPSFPNLPNIFLDIVKTLKFLQFNYPIKRKKYIPKETFLNIKDGSFKHDGKGFIMSKEAKNKLVHLKNINLPKFDESNEISVFWTEILKKFIEAKELSNDEYLYFLNIYKIYIYSFWTDIKDVPHIKVEDYIQNLALNISKI